MELSDASNRLLKLVREDLLTLSRISRSFGTTVALSDVSLNLRPGTVHALLGENGAGKTTLMRIAFGLLPADSGTVAINGQEVSIGSPADAIRHGIGMVHQHFTLVQAMTVAENVALGGRGLFSPHKAAEVVRRIATETGLHVDPDALVGSLPVSAQQRCEIIKAVSRNVRVLILDEPTALLAPDDASELLTWIREFAKNDCSVVLITHKLRDAMAVCDNFTVLRHGKVVLAATGKDAVSERSLGAAMIGSSAGSSDTDAYATDTRGIHSSVRVSHESHAGVNETTGRTLVAEAIGVSSNASDDFLSNSSVTDAGTSEIPVKRRGQRRDRDWSRERRESTVKAETGSVFDRVQNISLKLFAGEIVGVAAVEGSGQHSLTRLFAGRLRPLEGQLLLPDNIGFIPEDRHRDALMTSESLTLNVALHGAGKRTGRISWRAMRDRAVDIVRQFDVRSSTVDDIVQNLSGGNQQKLVAGRELFSKPRLLVAENPTRGLDFASTAALHKALRAARESGAAVLLYSSDLDEVMALSDRIVVLHNGSLVETTLDRSEVGRAMLGVR